jgi:predicted NACHT family NTPase
VKHYDWPRFWCPREGGSLLLDGGYLSSGAVQFKSVFPFKEISHISCLALLGEPGIGKSNAIRDAYEARRIELGPHAEERIFSFDLSPFGDENRLIRSLFEIDKFKAWRDGSYPLDLYLDSLDEGLLRIDTLALLLVDELKKYPISRLNLRIACRTAEWPPFLEQKLKQLWGEENFKAYELAPLRAEDIGNAALSEGLDATAFLSEIYSKEASPLAAKPVTLRLLLNLYKKELHLPQTQAELYERGCVSLCQEPSDTRKAAKAVGELTATQRLRLAGRIAAISIFCNKANIWTSDDTGEQLESDVIVTELAGGYEKDLDNTPFHVTEAAVRETYTNTGLFTARGINRMGWAHQTFAEFLAAWYLDYLKLDDDAVLRLLRNYDDEESLLVPQLYETAAWIASRRPQVFRRLIRVEPLVLLRSDVLAADEKTRADLVDALLNVFADEQEIDHWDLRHNYRKLKHSGLAAQLRPYIHNKDLGFLVRRVAIDIAERCQSEELREELADIALDQDEPLHTRVNAAVAVSRIHGLSSTGARLKPLALGEAGADPDLELKGYGLICVWPEHMSPKELFDCLVQPVELFYGGYQSFLDNNLLQNLRVEDLPIALAWAKRECLAGRLSDSLEGLLDEILIKAWAHLDEPEILASFVRLALMRINHHEDVLTRYRKKDEMLLMRQDAEKRKLLLKHIFPLLTNQVDWYLIGSSKLLALQRDDVNWLIEELFNAGSEQLQGTIADIIKSLMSPWSGTAPDVLADVYVAYKQNESFRLHFADLFEPVMLDSLKAQQMREVHEQTYNWRKKKKDQEGSDDEADRPLSPPPVERVLLELAKFEKGDLDGWWRLNLEMTLESGSRYYGSELEPDLMNLPGWNEASEATRTRIIAAAKSYVLLGNPQADKWVGTNTLYRPAFAGYRALYSLPKLDLDFFNSVPPPVWQKWAPIVFHYPVLNGSGEEAFKRHRSLIALAYRHSPGDIVELLLAEIEGAKQAEGFFSLEKLEGCWDARLRVALRCKLNDSDLPTKLMSTLLSKLLELGDSESEDFAHSLLTLPLPKDETARGRSAVAARSLLQYSRDAGWQSVWPAITGDAEFGKTVFESIAFSLELQNHFRLSEQQIADLYLWLSRSYPREEDPSNVGVHFVGAREEIARWRESLLQHLKRRGTPEAVKAIERISNDLPDLQGLKWILIEAKKNMRQHMWKPLQPSEVVMLAETAESGRGQPKVEAKPKAKAEQTNLLLWGKPVGQLSFLTELLDSYRSNPDDFAFFVGAGLSSPLFPSWPKLLKEMIAYCGERLDEEVRDELFTDLEHGRDFLDIASACHNALGITNYRQFIAKTFLKRFSLDDVSLAYRELFKLRPSIIVTTNFDLIPDHLRSSGSLDESDSKFGSDFCYDVFTHKDVTEASNSCFEHQPVVFKMHGTATDQDSIIFTFEEFRRIISDQKVATFLKSLFVWKTVVFIGYSFSDPHINDILGFLWNVRSGKGHPHYLIGEFSKTRRLALERKYEIRVLSYVPSKEDHPEVPEFIRLLAGTRER